MCATSPDPRDRLQGVGKKFWDPHLICRATKIGLITELWKGQVSGLIMGWPKGPNVFFTIMRSFVSPSEWLHMQTKLN